MAWFDRAPRIVQVPWLLMLGLCLLNLRQLVLWDVGDASSWMIARFLVETLAATTAVIAIPFGRLWGLTLGAAFLLSQALRVVVFTLRADVPREKMAGSVLMCVVLVASAVLVIYARYFRSRGEKPTTA